MLLIKTEQEDKGSLIKRSGNPNVLSEDEETLRNLHSTNHEMNFSLTKSRILIILIILTGAFIYVYIDDEETDVNDRNPRLPEEGFNESVIAGFDKWWEKMFCSQLNIFLPFFKEEQKLMLGEFYVDVIPQKDEFKNIYMIENDCKSTFTWRMRCSAESAAKANPNATLYIITIVDYLTDENQVMSRWLQKYPNIYPVRLNLNRLFHKTPLERFSSRKAWTKVKSFMHAHVSDAMRLALIWRSGGTYYDSDIIVVRSIPEEDNVFMLESYFRVVNAFIKAKKKHPLLAMSMEYFRLHYNKRKWDSNGPELLSNMIQSYCKTKDIIPGYCEDLTIVDPVEGIQPVHWKDNKELFKEITSRSRINDVRREAFSTICIKLLSTMTSIKAWSRSYSISIQKRD